MENNFETSDKTEKPNNSEMGVDEKIVSLQEQLEKAVDGTSGLSNDQKNALKKLIQECGAHASNFTASIKREDRLKAISLMKKIQSALEDEKLGYLKNIADKYSQSQEQMRQQNNIGDNAGTGALYTEIEGPEFDE